MLVDYVLSNWCLSAAIKVSFFLSRFKSIPSILDLVKLTVHGDIRFGSAITLKDTIAQMRQYFECTGMQVSPDSITETMGCIHLTDMPHTKLTGVQPVTQLERCQYRATGKDSCCGVSPNLTGDPWDQSYTFKYANG
ncbi:hypothetical protein BC332_09462 [Capsicum chinense]|nr:hypothetical protein BC332_09462 [Capsicum chinense]